MLALSSKVFFSALNVIELSRVKYFFSFIISSVEILRSAAFTLTAGGDPEKLKEAILKAADWSRKEYLDDQKEIEKLTEEKYSWKISTKILWEAYRKR